MIFPELISTLDKFEVARGRHKIIINLGMRIISPWSGSYTLTIWHIVVLYAISNWYVEESYIAAFLGEGVELEGASWHLKVHG